MMKRISWIGLAALACWALAQGPYTLKHDAKVGERFYYTVTADIDYTDSKALVTGKVLDKTIKIGENGDYDVESSYTFTKIKIKNEETELNPVPDTVTYSPIGEVVKIAGKADSTMYRLNNLTALVYPSNPIKAEETWKHTTAANVKTGAVEVVHEYRVTGLDKVNNIECLVVKVSARETFPAPSVEKPGPRPASCEGTLWIEIATSTLVKKELSIKNMPVPPKITKPVIAKLTVVRETPPAEDTTPPTDDGKSDGKE